MLVLRKYHGEHIFIDILGGGVGQGQCVSTGVDVGRVWAC